MPEIGDEGYAKDWEPDAEAIAPACPPRAPRLAPPRQPSNKYLLASLGSKRPPILIPQPKITQTGTRLGDLFQYSPQNGAIAYPKLPEIAAKILSIRVLEFGPALSIQ